MALNHRAALAIAVLAACSSVPAGAVESFMEVSQQANIPYATGGIGVIDTGRLEDMKRGYNLHVMNADRHGHFSGNARIVISDRQHRTVLDVEGGPIFYARLPNGQYIAEGFSEGQHKTQAFTITKNKPARVRFVWPEDMRNAPHYR